MQTPQLLDKIAEEINKCFLCSIAYGVDKRVFYRGSAPAPVLIVGEAPGAQENSQGSPFVGRSGQLLDKALATPEVNLTEKHVCITNLIKCWPGYGNPDPTSLQIKNCSPFLDWTIRVCQPIVILTLGSYSGNYLTRQRRKMPFSKLRSRTWEYQSIPVICAYHPAYLLRNEGSNQEVPLKVEFWKDLQLAAAMARKAYPQAFKEEDAQDEFPGVGEIP